MEEDQCHLTEKIFKPMMLEKPFVVNGTKGYLKELKRLGFKTFSDVIDESYDDAEFFWLGDIHKSRRLVPQNWA